jgi:hypothetical protein
MCGVKTNIVTSVEISDGYANDYNYYKPLLETTAGNGFNMAEVSADKAYLGAPNLLTTLQHGAIPYIPFKSNSKAGQSSQRSGIACSIFSICSTARTITSGQT